MLAHVLVPLDGSQVAECVLPHVVALAAPFKAQVSLLQVLERSLPTGTRFPIDPLDWQLLKVEADSYLGLMKNRLEKHEVSAQKNLLEGNPAERIVEFVRNNHADMVILSSHGYHGRGYWNISDIAQQILQQIPTSMMIIRAGRQAATETDKVHYRRILVPLDGSWRAESALPMAVSLAQAHEAELLLVHVVSKPEMARRLPLTVEDAELINRVVERNQAEGQKYLDEIQSKLPGNPQTRLLVSDNVMVALQSLVQQEQIDLVILCAHGYSGEAKWGFGSVTGRFITYGTTPVLIVQDLLRNPFEFRDNGVRQQTTRMLGLFTAS
jgi:nucleotide-binding universal stress UspA family protein